MSIKGYKVFDPDWTCRDFKYEVGKTYTHDGNIEVCKAGFHFCQRASDCFNYYHFDSNNKVAEVEATGLIKTDNDKSVTDKIFIKREIKWNELLDIVNEGRSCTGLCNTGDCNTGDWNTGNWNTGNRNTGDCNTGTWNTGNGNTGNRNTGNWNTGNRNMGNWNTGNWNTGDWNTGDCNMGSCNTGSWNKSNWSCGFFNTAEQQLIVFNKPLNMDRKDFLKNIGVQVLDLHYTDKWWICSENMTDEEKAAHPEHLTTGGYLKTVDFETACKMMWDNLDDKEKAAVKKIPNFDAEIFEEITGIKV